MNIEDILKCYDNMFGVNSLDEIEQYLVDNIAIARESQDKACEFTLLSEIIGFCRDTTQMDKAVRYCDELFARMRSMGIEGTVEYATACLNIANAYRAFGLHTDSMLLYIEVLKIYDKHYKGTEFDYASLYNNWSLLYQEMGELALAMDMLYKALKIVDTYQDALIPQATTRTNLAVTLIGLGEDDFYDEAMEHLNKAIDIFEQDGGDNYHYPAALVAMGDACVYKKDFTAAAEWYRLGMEKLVKHMGKNDNYSRILEKYNYAVKQCGKPCWTGNLDRCREFYVNHGRPMIASKFSNYEQRIAVGLVGEGSDCYGFDDYISTDHDYELGFCMWLTAEDYKDIGDQLQHEYEKLLYEQGVVLEDALVYNPSLSGRRGVFLIDEFYDRVLGVKNSVNNLENTWTITTQERLAEATNGQVFRDDLGEFTRIREVLLGYYPEIVWKQKLANELHDFSQYSQSNYPRMMARGDYATAAICKAKAMEAALDVVYLLNKHFAPYYKWKRKGVDSYFKLSRVGKLVDSLALTEQQSKAWKDIIYDATKPNYEDENVKLFDDIAGLILEELRSQKLVDGDELFLEAYVRQLLGGQIMSNQKLIDKIVELEWKMFDKVKNEGGRADCQDDWNTFSLMRKSQYMAWDEALIESYLKDLEIADSKGWNMIMEKYARMMKTTAPEKYEELAAELPVITEDRVAIQENIIAIQVAWMEEFAEKYPKMAGNSRTIRTSTDNAYNTSYETYLRGELSTYSERTFVLYGRLVTRLYKEGKNLAYEIMTNTAKLYGYDNVEDAENRL